MNYLVSIFVIGLIIFFHELGHFLAAKKVGMKVLKFSIGFGPRLIGFKKGETEYCISWLPLFGGYVKLAGESPWGRKGTPEEFSSQPKRSRFTVAFSGPLANFLVAVGIYSLVFLQGIQVPVMFTTTIVGEVIKDSPAGRVGLQPGDRIITIDGQKMKDWNEITRVVSLNPGRELRIEILRGDQQLIKLVTPEKETNLGIGYIGATPYMIPMVGEVIKGSPAEKAGLRSGDLVLAVDGEKIENWLPLVEKIRNSKAEYLVFTVKRGNEELSFQVKPQFDAKAGRRLIGIGYYINRRYSIFSAFYQGIRETKDIILLTITAVRKMVSGEVSLRGLAGPVGMVQMTGEVARSGWQPLLFFAAFISANLAMINLLPIPIADGGQILFVGLEAIRGRPLTLRQQIVIQQIGIAFLIFLFLLVTYNDLIRLLSLEGK